MLHICVQLVYKRDKSLNGNNIFNKWNIQDFIFVRKIQESIFQKKRSQLQVAQINFDIPFVGIKKTKIPTSSKVITWKF